jgi:hypothetical protein
LVLALKRPAIALRKTSPVPQELFPSGLDHRAPAISPPRCSPSSNAQINRAEREFPLALFAAGPPALIPIAVWQSELQVHIGQRGQELLLYLQGVRLAGEFRFRSAMKRRLNEGLALGAPHEASARNLLRKLDKPIERQVAVKILRETFLHRPLRVTKPKPADEIRDDKEHSDERRRARIDHASLIHEHRTEFREQALSAFPRSASRGAAFDHHRRSKSTWGEIALGIRNAGATYGQTEDVLRDLARASRKASLAGRHQAEEARHLSEWETPLETFEEIRS